MINTTEQESKEEKKARRKEEKAQQAIAEEEYQRRKLHEKKQREYEREYARIEAEEAERLMNEKAIARDRDIAMDRMTRPPFEFETEDLLDTDDITAINSTGLVGLSTYMPKLRGGGIEEVIAAMKKKDSMEMRAMFGGKFGPEAVKGDGVKRAVQYLESKGENRHIHADLCVNWQIRPSLLLVMGFTKSSGLTTGEGWTDEAILALPRHADDEEGIEQTKERRRAVIRAIKVQKRIRGAGETAAEIAYLSINKGMIRSIFLLCVFHEPSHGFSEAARAYRAKHYSGGIMEVIGRPIPSAQDNETKHIELTNIKHFAESCRAAGIDLV